MYWIQTLDVYHRGSQLYFHITR